MSMSSLRTSIARDTPQHSGLLTTSASRQMLLSIVPFNIRLLCPEALATQQTVAGLINSVLVSDWKQQDPSSCSAAASVYCLRS